MTGKLITYVST